jgi:mRNA deadenylase 3'-5' endonuclease subunit Ccr4
MHKREKDLLKYCLIITALVLSPSSAFYLASPPPSIADLGGTVPEKVIAYAEQDKPDDINAKPSRCSDSGPFFWTERLGQNASEAILNRYEDAFPDFQGTNTQNPFSLLSWNILSQNLYDISIVQKCAANLKVYKFSWEQRFNWILETLSKADADVVCLQEVELDLFQKDLLPAMRQRGYDGAVQGGENVKEIKRRKGKGQRAHVVATFWKTKRFIPVNMTLYQTDNNKNDAEGSALMARGRTLTTLLKEKKGSPILSIINCHLEGHPNQYAARIRQLQHAMDDLEVRCSGVPMNGLCIAGDFNCELQSSVCSTYLRLGRVGKKGGLGGVHGTSALAVPSFLLECDEAAECLGPILEWGRPIPNEEMEKVQPHPFRKNSLVSAYPQSLGQADPRQHFTYCANSDRPVAGLDQIWYSGYSLTRLGLKKPLPTPNQRANILATGLPAPLFPSDHLPIGSVLDWTTCDPLECSSDAPEKKCTHAGIRELIITQKQAPPVAKPKSPIMAYAELDMLMVTCPFDTEHQQQELEAIVEDVPDLPPNNQKPSPDQLKKLKEIRERKKILLLGASENARKTMQRILKLKKEVASYESGF